MAYYREQGAPQDQQMLIALLREIQEEEGGVLSGIMVETIARAYGIPPAVLHALIRRVPSLCYEDVRHRLEICGACRKGTKLQRYIEQTYGVKSGSCNEKLGFAYRVTPCMKNCRNGPSVRWDGKVYGNADEMLIRRLLEE
ncbi:MAG: NAD(P)H-dependent oxidoreductase subunit E [Clostridia bacterium]|nr:NAD(P)H-dependent oxidoreductase subunit E [Clostridia bacterium]